MNRNTLNFSHLITFIIVADCKKVLEASKILKYSQPAITAHIRQLEKDMGAVLFTRSVKGVSLTAAGQKLYKYSKDILNLVDEAARDVSSSEDLKGVLSLSASTTIASYILPSLIAQFSKRYPNVSLSMTVLNSNDVISQISEGSVSIGLVEGVSSAPALTFLPFLEDEVVLIQSSQLSTPLKKLKDLHKVGIIWRERGSGTREVVERSLAKLGVDLKTLQNQFEMGNAESIKQAVSENMGVSFLSKSSIQQELRLGKFRVVDIKGLEIKRQLHWVLPSSTLTGLNKLFFDFVSKMVSLPVDYIPRFSI